MENNTGGFFISDNDLKIFDKWIKSKKGQNAMKKIIEKCNKSYEQQKIAQEDRMIADAEWWAKNKNIPFII